MYASSPDLYCYPGTTVLKNRLDIRDQHSLDAFEADAVTQRGLEPLPVGRFSISHFRSIHRHLFQDVYSWAGNFRTVRIAKDSSMFCYPEHIAAQLSELFVWLAEQNRLVALSADAFSERGAHFLSELNAIHAFREGNGRAQMAFFAMLSSHAGHPLELDRMEPDSFLDAMIRSFNGKSDELAKQLRMML